MSELATASRRFLKALIRAGHATRTDRRGFLAEGGALRARLDEAGVAVLEARGLVRCANGVCYPAAEAGAFLQRQAAGGDGFAAQHRELAPGPEGSLRDLGNDLIEKLARAGSGGFLAPHHVEAGRRVSLWGLRAQLRQRVTMSYDPAQVGGRRQGGGTDIADMAAEARQSLNRLYAELPRDCAETVVDVCVFEKGLQEIESERGWPRRSAKLVLRIGLDRLAETLGLRPLAEGRARGQVQGWLGTDFAPTRFE
jgi:hypothetical protein